MTPEEIVAEQEDQTIGCKSCHWYAGENSGGNRKYVRVCDASQPAFPNGGKDVCKGWYRPRTAKHRVRGRN